MNGTDGWPLVLNDRCEANFLIPGIAEFGSTITGFAFIFAGIIPLMASEYSDDELDLVSAFTAANGVAAVLSHGTNLRIFGRADALTINVGSLLYTKAYLFSIFPQWYASAFKRTCVSLVVVLCITLYLAWNQGTVPAHIFEHADVATFGIIPCFIVVMLCSYKLVYGKSTWHEGKPKRVFLIGTFVFVFSFACWIFDHAKILVPCPSPVSLHIIWHLGAAHALMAWMAFLRYHRGRFFGFKPKICGFCWCPYTVWERPDDAMSNPMIRHSQTRKKEGESGRRNSYTMPQIRRPSIGFKKNLEQSLRQVWRGESFYGPARAAAANAAARTAALHDFALEHPPRQKKQVSLTPCSEEESLSA